MHNRIRMIMTQEGMRALRKALTYGYLISADEKVVRVLEDDKKSIITYSRAFWKPYHLEENF